MRFLIYSMHGDFAGACMRLQEEGNMVDLFIKEDQAKDTLKGLVNQVPSLAAGLAKNPDCVVFDMCKSGNVADRLMKLGYNVIGGSSFCDKLELDRTFGMDLCKRLGVKVPEFTEFAKGEVKQAIAFLKETKQKTVLKPLGNAGTDMTYVSKDTEDMIRFLTWADMAGKIEGPFLLQEFQKGIELSTEVWFSQGEVVYPPNGTMEEKKFMAGDVGPNTGCQGSTTWSYVAKEPRIIQQTLKKLYPAMRAAKFTGPLDMNTIVTEEGKAYFLEFTARFGYSAIYALAEILEDPLGKVLYDCSTGKLKEMRVRPEFGLALRCSIPPFPLDGSLPGRRRVIQDSADKPLRNVPKGHTWLLDAKLAKDGTLATAGIDGAILEITASDTDLEKASEKVYKMAKDVDLADMQYRNDAFKRPLNDLVKLKGLGYEMPDPKMGPGKKDGRSVADNRVLSGV